MSDLERQLHEDRLMRDTARALIDADIELVKGNVHPKTTATKLLGDARLNTRFLAEDAAEFASANKARIGTGLVVVAVALLAWFFRRRIGEFIGTNIASGAEPDASDVSLDDEQITPPGGHNERA